jgi:signal transduction histidine kinase
MPAADSSSVFRYSIAFIAVAATVGLRLALEEYTSRFSPFLLFAIPVLFVSWFYGRGPGLFATALSGLSIQYFFISTERSFGIRYVGDLVALTLFVAEGVVISFFAAAKKKAEESVQTINRELERRIDVRTRELEATHEELRRREALATLGTGVSKVAHEIANPLNALSTSIQLLERYRDRQYPTDNRLGSIVEDARGATAQMQSLIKELREVAKPVTLNLAPVSLSETVREVIRLPKPSAIQIEEFMPSDLPLVMADSEKLKTALINLWQNALEAMPDGGAVRFKAYNSGPQVCLEIQDTGVGVPKEMDVFAPFTTSKRDGGGLGLVIVRNIVLAHKGSIEYTSEPGQGTTFKLCLPALIAAE